MTAPPTRSGTTIIDSGSNGRAGDLDRAWVEVGVVRQDRLVPVDDPAGDPDAERADVVHDHVGEPVAGHDRPADRGLDGRPGRSSASRR